MKLVYDGTESVKAERCIILSAPYLIRNNANANNLHEISAFYMFCYIL